MALMPHSRPMPSPTAGRLRRRSVLSAVATIALPSLVRAQEYPTRPIRMMVGFAPGGGVDVSGRIVAPRLGEELRTSWVVENRAGASGMICSEYVAKSAPDGYTLMYTGGSAVTIAPQLVARPPIDSLQDLVPVNMVGGSPLVLSLSPSAGVRNLAEFLALARSKPVSLGSAGAGTLTHLTIEMLGQATGNKIIHVPYKGGGAAVVDALAGHVQGMISDPPPVLQHFQEGRLLPIAVTSDRRLDGLPGVPTLSEALPGMTAIAWNGFFAPAKTPQAIVERLSAAIVKVCSQDDVAAQLRKAGVIPSALGSPEEFRRFVAAESERWGRLVREKKITAG